MLVICLSIYVVTVCVNKYKQFYFFPLCWVFLHKNFGNPRPPLCPRQLPEWAWGERRAPDRWSASDSPPSFPILPPLLSLTSMSSCSYSAFLDSIPPSWFLEPSRQSLPRCPLDVACTRLPERCWRRFRLEITKY